MSCGRWSRTGWDSYPDRFGLLRQLANLDSIVPVPIEKIWPALEKAAENSPDDDRIWLGRANLAIRTGEFARAETLAGRLPASDVRVTPRSGRAGWTWPLRRAKLPLLGRLSSIFRPTASRLTEVLALRAWFAARSGDQERERQALRDAARARAWPDPGRGAAGRARTARRTAGGCRPAARAEGRAGSGQDPLRDPRDETQRGGSPPLGRDGAPGRGAGPVIRGPVPLVRGTGAHARRSGGPRSLDATGTSQSGPRRPDARRPPRRARPGCQLLAPDRSVARDPHRPSWTTPPFPGSGSASSTARPPLGRFPRQ